MQHPDPATWIGYLYGEISEEQSRSLAAHLDECPACQAQLAGWQETRRRLDAWSVSADKPVAHARRWIYRWPAVAAAALIALGFAAAWWSVSAIKTQALRTQIESDLRRQLRQEWRSWQAAERRLLWEALQSQETRTTVELARLRRDLETVAVWTDTGLQSAQNRINQLVTMEKTLENDNR